MNSISLEHLKKNKRIVASYLLLCVSAKADVDLFDIKKNKNKIIKSDYLLIMGCGLDKKINLREIDSLVY